ncbi:MAG: PP2C family protein-serine/threonine phosphatase [Pseudomonadota bacterium]
MLRFDSILIKNEDALYLVRDKLLYLLQALGYPSSPAKHMVCVFSSLFGEMFRHQPSIKVDITLHHPFENISVAMQIHFGPIPSIRLHQLQACMMGNTLLFDNVQWINNASDELTMLTFELMPHNRLSVISQKQYEEIQTYFLQKTREELIDALHENARLLERYTLKLEDVVEERTEQLKIVNNKLKNDLTAGVEYVKRLLPKPINTPVKVDWYYQPTDDLGGDIFGYHAIDETHYAFYLLDVTGHGLDSALLSVSVMNVLSSGSLAHVDFCEPASVIHALNHFYPMQQYGGKMFSIWYGVLNVAQHRLRWCGAGHPDSLLYSFDDKEGMESEPFRLVSSGPPIGIMDTLVYETHECFVKPGDRLFVFSDGAFEIRLPTGELLTYEDFVQFMSTQPLQEEHFLQNLYQRNCDVQNKSILDDDFSALRITF